MNDQNIEKRQIETPEKPLRPIVFPGFAEKTLGREILDTIKEMGQKLEEYEMLARDRKLALWEIAEYIQAIDLIEECRQRIQILKGKLREKHKSAIERFRKESYPDPEKKWAESLKSSFQGIQPDERPILKALIAELIIAEAVIGMEELIENSEEEAIEEAIYMQGLRSIKPAERGNLTIVIANHLFVRTIKNKTPARKPDTGNPHTEKTIQETGESIMRNEIEEGEYALQIKDFPWIQEIKIVKRKTDDPMVWGMIFITWNNKHKDYGTAFNISHLTADPCGSGLMLTPAKETFGYYGIEETYPEFFGEIYEAIEDALTSGRIPIKKDTEVAAIEEAIEKAVESEESSLNIETETREEIREEVRDTAIEEPSTQTLGTEKPARMKRNIQFLKAKNALRRIGVTISEGGKHIKLSYEGRSAAFPRFNPGQTRGVSHLIKSALKMLGIPNEDFIKALL